MTSAEKPITTTAKDGGSVDYAGALIDQFTVWTSSIKARNTQGRGSSKKRELYGIKKLRELILELAVRGKLVPQDPNEEPASELLKRIAEEKARLIKDGELKKQKPFPEITDDEKPFELPSGWASVRFGAIALHNAGKTLDKGRNTGELRNYITTSNLYWGAFKLDDLKKMPIKNEELKKCSARKNDLLICEGGEAGRAAVWPYENEICFQNHVHRARLFGEISPYYMFRVFQWLDFTGLINNFRKGVGISNMSGKSLASIPFGLPPVGEQHRIVAKVDELMALCDQLEQQTESSLDAHKLLVDTLLASLLKPAEGSLTDARDANELSDNWARLADHFDTLITTDYAVEQLKQTILQLAVQGKLVPQDPNVEPASELLKRIATEKEQLIKDKKIKKQKPLPEITDEEKPFELPDGWGWSRIGDAISLKNGYAFKSKYFVHDPTPFVLTTPGNFYETGGFRSRGDKTRFYDGDVESEFILNSGDLIIPMTEQAPGLLGSSAFIPDDGKKYIHNQRLGKLTPYCSSSTTLEFIALFFNAPYLRRALAESCTGTTVRHTSPDRIYNVLFPVFSVSEQHRIVAKVDELMTLCDQLKANINKAQIIQLYLTDSMSVQALMS